jgi:hypothetical protein
MVINNNRDSVAGGNTLLAHTDDVAGNGAFNGM